MFRLLRVLVVTLFETALSRLRRGPARPSWGFVFEWVVRFLRVDFDELSRISYGELRRDLNARTYPSRSLKHVSRTRERIGEIPCVWFTPKEVGPGLVLFLHGGSYIFGSVETSHAEYCAGLAERSGTRVLGIDYRLAPEHPYPAALEDALCVFDELVARGTAASQIAVAGDSAGGNLALSLQLALIARGSAQARAALLISPWVDLSASRPSCQMFDSLDYGQTRFLLQHARDFAAGRSLTDPKLSPLFAPLDGLARVAIIVGSAERLYDEGIELAERARKAGAEVEVIIAEDMPHNAPAISTFHPNADRSFQAGAEYIRNVLQNASS